MSLRPLFALISLVFVAGAVLLEFFLILAGAINGNPLNQFYFLEVDTSGIRNAPQLTHWTYWNSCPVDSNGLNTVCSVTPAYAFDPQNNFGTQTGVPVQFIGTNKFYLETRFMFAFALIALVFSVVSLLFGGLALISRIGSYLSSTFALAALVFQAATAALMTAAFVEGRNIFTSNNQTATLGRYGFGFQWAAVAALFIASALFCAGGTTSKDSSRRSAKNRGSFIDGDASSFTRAA